MNESLFIQYVQRFFPGLVQRVTQTLNGSQNANAQRTYLHKQMLRSVYSPTLKWDSISVDSNIVAADVVAMDSSLPLKKRDTLSRASGDIPKMGMELKLNERQMTDLDILSRTPGQEQQLIAQLFADTPRVIGGIYERCEQMFLEGLSTGVALIEDTETVGTGIRVDYGFLPKNKFGVSSLWSGADATPFTDIQAVLDQAEADGNNITTVMLDQATFRNIARTDEAKEMYAASINFFGANVAIPTLDQLNAAMQGRYGFQFQIVNRSIVQERNGVRTSVKPWAAGQVAFLTTTQVGTLTYGTLAEANHPVQGVAYQTADNYILVSKYRRNEPSLSEHTRSQALVLPVINNVDQIYLLDSTSVEG